MGAGRPGDGPYTDILLHGREAISPEVTRLVKAIVARGDGSVNEVVEALVQFMEPNQGDEFARTWTREYLERVLRSLEGISRRISGLNPDEFGEVP